MQRLWRSRRLRQPSCTEVALRYCFCNVGRFVRDYRVTHVENPSGRQARTAMQVPTERG